VRQRRNRHDNRAYGDWIEQFFIQLVVSGWHVMAGNYQNQVCR